MMNGSHHLVATTFRAVLRVGLAGTIVMVSVAPAAGQQTPADSAARRDVFQRAQRLVNDGNGVAGRAVLDSLLTATVPRSPAEAEVLFQRATIAESWDQAQRDYLRVMLEHDRSPQAAAAMLRLAQGELARGDRVAALRYLERLASEAPESPLRGEAGVWHGRLLIDRGARNQGCAVLRTTRARVDSTAIELVNQYDYLLRSCPAVATDAAPRAVQPAAPAAVPATASATPAPTGAMEWSVQVAAWPTLEEAERYTADLRARGYPVRVDGTSAPFRVRIGHYPTREAATAAMTAYKQKERGDAFLVQVPRR